MRCWTIHFETSSTKISNCFDHVNGMKRIEGERDGKHSVKSLISKYFHSKCNYLNQMSTKKKLVPTRKRRVKKNWLKWKEYSASECTLSGMPETKKLHREKVSKFKLKRLTTLNYNMLDQKKARLLQCVLFSTITIERQKKKSREEYGTPRIERLSFVYIYAPFATCQHFYN